MILDDLRDQLKERFTALGHKIQESPAFIQLMEKYDSLEPRKQRLVAMGVAAVIALALLMLPLAYYTSSSERVSEFNDIRNVIQGLMQVRRDSGKLQAMRAPMAPDVLRMQATSVVQAAGLQPQQVGPVNPFENPAGSNGISKNIQQKGVEVTLNQLNLRQIVQIAARLQSLDASVRMSGLDIKASQLDPHFYDVVYRLVTFSIPEEPAPPAPGSKPKPTPKPGGG